MGELWGVGGWKLGVGGVGDRVREESTVGGLAFK